MAWFQADRAAAQTCCSVLDAAAVNMVCGSKFDISDVEPGAVEKIIKAGQRHDAFRGGDCLVVSLNPRGDAGSGGLRDFGATLTASGAGLSERSTGQECGRQGRGAEGASHAAPPAMPSGWQAASSIWIRSGA